MTATAWQERRKAIGRSGLPASDRSVFRELLAEADYKTGELPEQWSPTESEIRDRSGLSLRQVQYSLRHLERHGWVKVTARTSRGYVVAYQLQTGSICDCTGRRHVPSTQPSTQPRAQPKPAEGAVSASSRVQPLHGQNGHAAGQRPVPGRHLGEGVDRAAVACIGGCGKPARHGCVTCWDHASLEAVR